MFVWHCADSSNLPVLQRHLLFRKDGSRWVIWIMACQGMFNRRIPTCCFSQVLCFFSFFFFLCITLFFFLFFFFLYFIFKLYIIVLVLPNIKMNLPQVCMCSPSWTLLPPPSPYHPSGSSQCTSPKHPVSCIEPGQSEVSQKENTNTVY